MSFPAGVQLATLTFSNPLTFLGNEATKTDMTIQASAGVVWAETGTPIDDFAEFVTPGAGMPGQLTAPFVDQPGFTDQAGNVFTMWTYVLTRRTTFGGATKLVKKYWQPVLGQTTVDFDNLPGGTVGLPVSAPIVPVTSVAGFTLAVGAEDLAGALNPFLPAGVTPEDVASAVAAKQDAATLDAAVTAKITTPGSAVAGALSATYALKGEVGSGALVYSGGAYPARPAGAVAVTYIGPVQPTTWLANDSWVDNS
jgi:hypothetical protein